MTAPGAADPEPPEAVTDAGRGGAGTLPATGAGAPADRVAADHGTAGGAAGATGPSVCVDVVALGESMVTFLPSRPGRLADVPSFERGIGGAESNAACALAGAGHSVKWVSRVGADGFGRHLVEKIASYGVDTGDVQLDPDRPTGIYFRTAGERAVPRTAGRRTAAEPDRTRGTREGPADGTANTTGDASGAADSAPDTGPLSEVIYYRTGSAASAMSPATVSRAALLTGRVLYLSGITAALSADCLALLRDLMERPVGTHGGSGHPLISFDVNYRAGLWPDTAEAGAVLLPLARAGDIVFVGEDEAQAVWGVTGGPAAIRALLPEPAVLVVKQGATGATAFHRPAMIRGGAPVRVTDRPESDALRGDTVTFVPALHVDVVAPVGAGDAFAAGFLSATLRGLPVPERIRHGHLTAAAVLTVSGDLAAGPCRAHADRLAALDDSAWRTLRLGPGWTRTTAAGTAAPESDEEVHTA